MHDELVKKTNSYYEKISDNEDIGDTLSWRYENAVFLFFYKIPHFNFKILDEKSRRKMTMIAKQTVIHNAITMAIMK